MCEIAEGDGCDVWNTSLRKSRKNRKCSCCGKLIKVGEVYWAHFSVYEGVPSSETGCAQCHDAEKKFGEAHGGLGFCPSVLRSALEGCIDEGDESDAPWRAMLAEMKARAA